MAHVSWCPSVNSHGSHAAVMAVARPLAVEPHPRPTATKLHRPVAVGATAVTAMWPGWLFSQPSTATRHSRVAVGRGRGCGWLWGVRGWLWQPSWGVLRSHSHVAVHNHVAVHSRISQWLWAGQSALGAELSGVSQCRPLTSTRRRHPPFSRLPSPRPFHHDTPSPPASWELGTPASADCREPCERGGDGRPLSNHWP